LKNKVQAAFCVSALCGQCFQQCLAQIVQPLRLGGGEAHGGDLAVVVAQAACIKRVKYGLRLGNGRERLATGGNIKVITMISIAAWIHCKCFGPIDLKIINGIDKLWEEITL